MTTDHTALIAEARSEAEELRSVNVGNASAAWSDARLIDRLADALVQVTAELQQAQADARNSLSRAEDAQPLIAEAREFDTEPAEYASRLLGAHSLIDRLADALEQVTAELRQEREDHRSAHDALVFMAIELGWATDGRLATAVGHAKEVLRVRTAERDAAYTAIREALTHDPLHGKTWGLHCGGMAPCIRAILSRIPTEGSE